MSETVRVDNRTPRYSCILDSSAEGGQAVQYKPPTPIRVMNVTGNRIAVHGSVPFAVGTRLTLGLHSASRNALTQLPIQVVELTEHANGTYLVTGAFQKKSENEVKQFLV